MDAGHQAAWQGDCILVAVCEILGVLPALWSVDADYTGLNRIVPRCSKFRIVALPIINR